MSEITESLLVQDSIRVRQALDRLRRIGCLLALDDFGTGYSSLAYLTRFPPDKIKIDKSFIHDMSKGGDSIAIVRAIIDLARALKIEVVAEGCTDMQGYYFSKPAPIESFEQVLQERNGRMVLAA